MKRFNLRVYGIIEDAEGNILLSDERRFRRSFTKFPGGGLEWGEGLKEGLKRELMEEIGVEAEVGELFFFNDFFQESAFNENDQIFSFYFKIRNCPYDEINIVERPDSNEEGEWVRWVSKEDFSPELLTFPIDKIVADLI